MLLVRMNRSQENLFFRRRSGKMKNLSGNRSPEKNRSFLIGSLSNDRFSQPKTANVWLTFKISLSLSLSGPFSNSLCLAQSHFLSVQGDGVSDEFLGGDFFLSKLTRKKFWHLELEMFFKRKIPFLFSLNFYRSVNDVFVTRFEKPVIS